MHGLILRQAYDYWQDQPGSILALQGTQGLYAEAARSAHQRQDIDFRDTYRLLLFIPCKVASADERCECKYHRGARRTKRPTTSVAGGEGTRKAGPATGLGQPNEEKETSIALDLPNRVRRPT